MESGVLVKVKNERRSKEGAEKVDMRVMAVQRRNVQYVSDRRARVVRRGRDTAAQRTRQTTPASGFEDSKLA